mmetsp:Transcript_10456/g.18940  ORF Transcript_10456/g.18940 Transcript_10456/m.18940 type:complete len:134 (-) Transcript_10456:118-519(-)
MCYKHKPPLHHLLLVEIDRQMGGTINTELIGCSSFRFTNNSRRLFYPSPTLLPPCRFCPRIQPSPSFAASILKFTINRPPPTWNCGLLCNRKGLYASFISIFSLPRRSLLRQILHPSHSLPLPDPDNMANSRK